MFSKQLYFAYGSNLNMSQMGIRCPMSEPHITGVLENYALFFRGAATVEPVLGESVVGGLYWVEKSDVVALDIYEGYPSLYRKEYLPIKLRDGSYTTALVYVMNSVRPYKSPWLFREDYFETIEQGYKDWNLKIDKLNDGLVNTRKLGGIM